MRVTTERVREIARQLVSADAEVRTSGLGSVAAGGQELVASALELTGHDDRNLRVAALRVLAQVDEASAVEGLLRGLDDPVKRVREVAAKSCVRFVNSQQIVDRLVQSVDRAESGSSRPALQILSGVYTSPYGVNARVPVAQAVRWLQSTTKFRQHALSALLRTPVLTDEVATLLRDVVTDGTKDEAVAATRRLCGFRVAHHGEIDDETRRNSDRAWGDVFFWVRVPEER